MWHLAHRVFTDPCRLSWSQRCIQHSPGRKFRGDTPPARESVAIIAVASGRHKAHKQAGMQGANRFEKPDMPMPPARWSSMSEPGYPAGIWRYNSTFEQRHSRQESLMRTGQASLNQSRLSSTLWSRDRHRYRGILFPSVAQSRNKSGRHSQVARCGDDRASHPGWKVNCALRKGGFGESVIDCRLRLLVALGAAPAFGQGQAA